LELLDRQTVAAVNRPTIEVKLMRKRGYLRTREGEERECVEKVRSYHEK